MGRPCLNLVGQRFGKLVVISQVQNRKGHSYWNCLCDCGKEKIIRGSHLKNGSIKSCGCINKELMNNINMRKKISINKIKASAKKNNLVLSYPEIVKEWHSTKNGNKRPEDYSYGSNINVWWQCLKIDCKHEWSAIIANRICRNSGCPACANRIVTTINNLQYLFPEIAKELHPDNKIPADQIIAGSNKQYKWQCSTCKHIWKAQCNNRTFCGRGCSICNDTTNMRPKWEGWEILCKRIGENLYGSLFKTKPRLNGLIPDFQYDNILIDAKTNVWIPEIEKDIINYFLYCDRLEFWCLELERPTEIRGEKEVVFINADTLLQRISDESFKQECKEEIEQLRKWKYEPITDNQQRLEKFIGE